ncbi:hypothetical protein [Acanthopleuribacter pedis]|uniref:Uncharacterized protein n=1 Tax=Acanthopleuribacter pedis TaxID=442870 RepID=A0A8J7Q3Z4_9BACT|nr:hypothetical protein [Acanthopleuribacter pedis]MBO1317637.1 hypothetical protein [Acanthopleuribacter pedis]
MSENPFQAPDQPLPNRRQTDDALQNLSKKELKKLNQQHRNVIIMEWLIAIGATVMLLVTVRLLMDQEMIGAGLSSIFTLWLFAVSFLSMKRLPIGRYLAITHFSLMILSSIFHLVTGAGGLGGLVIPIVFLAAYIQAAPVFERGAPNRKEVKLAIRNKDE